MRKYTCDGRAVYTRELHSRPIEVVCDAEDREDAKFILAHSFLGTDEYNVHLDLRTVKPHIPKE
jgi:hypothetical protein